MTEANYKKSIWLSFFSLVLFFLFVPILFGSAAFSETINYQGKLMDDAGDLVADGSYNMRFRLCADDACASVLYDEYWVDSDKVAVTNGLFSVLIGSVSSTLGSVDFNQSVYLEISVGGTGTPSWETLTPRKQLGAVPNAFNSKKFDGLTTSSVAVLDRENTFTKPNTWDFGAGGASISVGTTSFLGFDAALISGLLADVIGLLATNDNFAVVDSDDSGNSSLFFSNVDGSNYSGIVWNDYDTYGRFAVQGANYKNNFYIDGVTAGVELGGSDSINAALYSVDQASGSKIVTLSDETNGAMGYFTADGGSDFVKISDFSNNYSLHVYSPNNFPAIFETNVGIGTTTPNNPLVVSSASSPQIVAYGNGNGGIFMSDRSTSAVGGSGIIFASAGVEKAQMVLPQGDDTNLRFADGLGSALMTINLSTGNVGIGTTTPSNRLVVSVTSSYAIVAHGNGNSGLFMSDRSTSNAGASGILFASAGSAKAGLFLPTGEDNRLMVAGFDAFGNTQPFMNIALDSGNIGIGTTTPAYGLDVWDDINIADGYKLRYNGEIVVQASTTQNNYYFGPSGNLTGTGGANTALGSVALVSNTSGASSTALGYASLNVNTSGNSNVAVGANSLGRNTIGDYNTALGASSLFSNIQGSENVAVGFQSLYYSATSTGNTAVGFYAGIGSVESANQYNSLFGYKTGYALSTGSNNLLLGYQSGDSLTTGSNNIIMGYDVDAPTASTSNYLNIGNALYGNLQNGYIGIGTSSPSSMLSVVGTSTFVGDINIADTYALKYNNQTIAIASTTLNNYFFGGAGNLTTTGGGNSGFGKYAMISLAVDAVGNSGFGFQALANNTEGDLNNAFGYQSLASNVTGYHNVGYGASTLYTNTGGDWNSAIGSLSLYWNQADYNTALGANSLYYNVNGAANVALGMEALYNNATSSKNTAVGYRAGYGSAGSENQNNSLFGYYSGYGLTTGSNNVLMGYQSGNSLTSGANNIIIGYDVDAPTSTTSNYLNIGNLLHGDLQNSYLGIGTSTPQTALHVVGTSTLESVVMGYGSIIGQNDNYITFNNLDVGGSLVPYQSTYIYDAPSTSTIKFLNNFEQGISIANNLDDGLSSLFAIVNNYATSTNTHNLNFGELTEATASTTNFIFNGNLLVAGALTGVGLEVENGLTFSGSLEMMANNLELPHKLRNLYIADNYAYTISYATNSVDSFRIVDISNPSSPQVVGGAGLTGLPLSDGKRVWASGNYAYLLYNATGGMTNPFRIIDISDKSNPVVVGGEDLDLSGLGGSAGQPFYVSGKYAYVLGTESMHVVDISDPHSPRLVSSLSDVGYSNWDIKVVGDYAYVCARKVIGGQANPLTIVNVKDKTNPFIVKEVIIPDLATSTNLCWSLDVSGANVYLGMGTIGVNSSTESFRIVDVSNPNSPVVKGGRDIGTNSDSDLALSENYTAFNYVKVLGNRLYATTWMNDFLIIDVSSSTNPSIISKTRIQNGTTNTGSLTFDFRGNYVAVGYAPILDEYTTSTDYFRIFKLPGADIWGGHSDAFSAGSLQVLNNAVFNQRLTVWDSLEVGSGGIYTQGSISVMSTNTSSYFGGSIGIGTSTPAYKLSVYASNTTDYLIQVATSTNSGIFEIRNDGIGRFGGDLIVGGNSTTTGNMVVSGTGTSTMAGNLKIAQGKVLQVETIIAYSPLNVNTDMIISGNVTTTGQSIVNDMVTRSVAAHCSNADYTTEGDCTGNGETWHAVTDHDFTTQLQTGGYGYFSVLDKYFNSAVYGYSTSTDTTSGNITAVGVYGKASDVGVAGVGNAMGGFFYGVNGALMTIGANMFIGSGTFVTDSFSVGESGNSLLSISATTIGLGQYTAPSEFFGVQPSSDAGTVATARFKTWNNVDQLYLDADGNVGIATTTPQEKLVVAGNAIFTGNVTALSVTETSDANLKENVTELVYGLDDIMKLRPVNFDYISNGRHSIGFIAQEVKEIIPEVVHGSEGSYSLNYSVMTSLLTKGIQQQQQQINDLRVLVGINDPETSLVISSESSLDVDSLKVASAVTFQGTITVIGEAGFRSKVTFSDHVYFAQDAAGTAIIPIGATSTEVKFSKAYEVAPIITVTPKKKLSGIDWWVESETPEGFVIAIDPVLDQEIQFNWHAVAIKDSGLESPSLPEESNIEISPGPEEVISPDSNLIIFNESQVEDNDQQPVSATEPEQNAEEKLGITEQSEPVEPSDPPAIETSSSPEGSVDAIDSSPVVGESEAP